MQVKIKKLVALVTVVAIALCISPLPVNANSDAIFSARPAAIITAAIVRPPLN